MAIDTLLVYSGVYGNLDDALADYEAVKELHVRAHLIDAYDAAVIERRSNGRSRSSRSTRPPPGPEGCWAAGSA
jgi:hypothetical protein